MFRRHCYLALSALIWLSPTHALASGDGPCNKFSPQIYLEAQTAFADWQSEFRLPQDDRIAVKLHDLILEGFDQERADALCVNGCDIAKVVNAKVGKMQTSAAHLAAMLGNLEALGWLRDKNADLHAKDKRDFTPAHFAALNRSKSALKFLKDQGADMHAANKLRATPRDLWRLTHLVEPMKQSLYVQLAGWPAPEQVTGQDFCAITTTRFIEGIKQKPIDVLETWIKEDHAAETPALTAVSKGLRTFKPSSDNFYIKQIVFKKFGELLFPKDYCLCAKKAFSPGDIAGVYAGEWSGEAAEGKLGLFESKVDVFRGHLPFAQHGFPNVILLPFANRFGVAEGNFAFVIRPIAPGDRIYTDVPLKNGKVDTWQEPNPGEIDDYLRANKLVTTNCEPPACGQAENLRNRAIANYIMRAVPVFVRLIAEQKMSAQNARDLSAFAGVTILATNVHGTPMSLLDTALIAMELYFIHPSLRTFFATKAREGDGMVLLSALQGWLPLHVTGQLNHNALEQHWQQARRSLCSAYQNADLVTCIQLARQERDEL